MNIICSLSNVLTTWISRDISNLSFITEHRIGIRTLTHTDTFKANILKIAENYLIALEINLPRDFTVVILIFIAIYSLRHSTTNYAAVGFYVASCSWLALVKPVMLCRYLHGLLFLWNTSYAVVQVWKSS